MLVRLKFLTAGESHGKALLGILDGVPSGFEISENYIGTQLARRQMGHGRGGRMKIENDWAAKTNLLMCITWDCGPGRLLVKKVRAKSVLIQHTCNPMFCTSKRSS